MDHSPPGSSVHWMLQARILEWVAFSFSRGSSRPRDQTDASSIAGRFFTAEPPGKSLPSLLWMITLMRSELPVTAAWPPDVKHDEPRDNLEGGFVGTKSGASERNWMPGNTREQPASAFSQKGWSCQRSTWSSGATLLCIHLHTRNQLPFRSLLRVAQHVFNLKRCFAVLPELIISHYYYNLMIIWLCSGA